MNSNRIDLGLKDIMHVKRLGQCLAQLLAIVTIKNHYLDKISDKETILLISKRITPILDKEREEKPFCNINDRERRILLAIEDAVKKNETNSIKHTLVDLSMVIESNQKALEKAERTNRWSIPISIIGVLLTLFIWFYGSSLSERDIERISTQITTTISEQIIVEQSDTCMQ